MISRSAVRVSRLFETVLQWACSELSNCQKNRRRGLSWWLKAAAVVIVLVGTCALLGLLHALVRIARALPEQTLDLTREGIRLLKLSAISAAVIATALALAHIAPVFAVIAQYLVALCLAVVAVGSALFVAILVTRILRSFE